MGLLAPLLLAGLAAIAVPVLVHLVPRERHRVLAFPSLMLLRKIPHPPVKRRAIRHWALLAMRAGFVALVAVAFARPFVRGASPAAAAGGGREVVVLLDRSFSLGHGDAWRRAQREARQVIDTIGPGDRASVALFADEVEIAVASSADRAALADAIRRASPSAGATRIGPALRAAAGLLDAARGSRREVVLVSDFQRSAWNRSEGTPLPPGAAFTPVPIAEADTDNAAVAGLMIDRGGPAGRETATLSARIVNHGDAPVSNREVTLDIDGQTRESRQVSVGPRAAATVTFRPVAAGGDPARIAVRLAPDALPIDDAFYAVLAPIAPVRVLMVESPNPPPDAGLFLSGALAVGRTPPFDVRSARVDRVTPAEIEAAAVVVLNDTRPPDGVSGRALERRVRAGAGLFVVAGGQAHWPTDAPDLLPGALGATIDRAGTRGGTLGQVDYGHPVFEVFRQPRSGDLTAPRIFRYRQLDASGRVVARYDDGAAALAERRVDRGLVLVWTSTLDSHWNDFALKPVFVPFVHESVRHLARVVEPRAWQTVGTTLDPAVLDRATRADAGGDPGPLVLVSPGGTRVPIEDAGANATASSGPAAASARGGATAAPRPLSEPGFYTIRAQAPGGGDLASVAVNVSAVESDLAAFDPAEMTAGIAAASESAAAPAASTDLSDSDVERRQALWWYVLAAGLALFVAEGAFASRLSRHTQEPAP